MQIQTNGVTGFHKGWLGLESKFSDITQLEAGILGFDKMVEVDVSYPKNGELEKSEQYKGIYNTQRNQLEAILTKDYHLLQHTDAFLPIIDGLRQFGLTDVSGYYGCTGKRAMVVLTFNDPRMTIDVRGDKMQIQLYLKHGVDGTLALWGTLGAFRLVCSNGMIVGDIIGQERWCHLGDKVDVENIPMFFESLIKQGIENSQKLSLVIEQAMSEMLKESVLQAVLMGSGLGRRYAEKILEKCKNLDVLNKWNVYNAVTEFITHEIERASFNSRLVYLKKANRILLTDTDTLVEAGRKAMEQEGKLVAK